MATLQRFVEYIQGSKCCYEEDVEGWDHHEAPKERVTQAAFTVLLLL